MFIDFEGIDGSGKTTLSNRVAQRLEALGHRVLHARENGELKSGLARRVRELTRDVRHLEMSPRAEFFLNLSRDAQQLEEVIQPALTRGEVVISDRYLYSQLALTAGGRGLQADALKAACALASQGVWPDLVVLVDVDPDLARWRKRLGRRPARSPVETGSRKGLSGAGLNVRVRDHFLMQARQDPERWLVLSNEGQSLEALEEEVLAQVLNRLRTIEGPRRRDGMSGASGPGIANHRRPLPLPGVASDTGSNPRRRATKRSASLQPSAPPPATAKTADSRFHDELSRLFVREPALAMAMLSGFTGGLAHRLRLQALSTHPDDVALSLRDLDDEPSWSLRDHLAERHPHEVARSIPLGPGQRASALRLRLFDAAPGPVLENLVGDEGPDAWALRERGIASGLGPVLLGLAGVRGERATAIRALGLREGLHAHVALSVSGLSDSEAEALREALLDQHPLLVLKSTLGLDTAVAARLREEFFTRAPKPVLRSLSGLTTDAAFALRERGAPLTKEAIDSLDGLDHPRAWALRERWLSIWPTTVASSLTGLPADVRLCSLLDRLLAAHPGRLLLLRNAALAMQVARALPGGTVDPRVRPAPEVGAELGQEGAG